MSDLPLDFVDGFSIAMGKIEANSSSLIHVRYRCLENLNF
jgi:hypothetical protein